MGDPPTRAAHGAAPRVNGSTAEPVMTATTGGGAAAVARAQGRRGVMNSEYSYRAEAP